MQQGAFVVLSVVLSAVNSEGWPWTNTGKKAIPFLINIMKIHYAGRGGLPLAFLGSIMSSCGSDDYCYDDPEITPSDGYLFKILNRSYNRRPSEASDTKFMRSVISAMTTPDHLSSIQSCPTNNPNSKETLRTFNEACEDLAAIQPRKEVIEPDVVLPTTRFRGNRYLQLGLAIMNAFSGKSSLRNAWDNIRRAALRIQRPIVGKESAKDRLPFRTDPS